MKREVCICDSCGQVIHDGYVLRGSLLPIKKQEQCGIPILDAKNPESHFCKMCFCARCDIKLVNVR